MISRSSADSNDTLMKTRSDTASDLTDSDSRAHRVAAAEAEEAEEAETEAEEAAYEQRLAQDRIERVSGSAPTVSVSGAALGGSHGASDATRSMSRCVPLTNPFSPYATPHLPCTSPDALFGAVSAAHTRTAACNLRSRVSVAALWPRHLHPEELPSQLRPWPSRGQQRWLRRQWQPLGRCRHWRQCRRVGANPPSRLPSKLQPQSFKPQILHHPTAPE